MVPVKIIQRETLTRVRSSLKGGIKTKLFTELPNIFYCEKSINSEFIIDEVENTLLNSPEETTLPNKSSGKRKPKDKPSPEMNRLAEMITYHFPEQNASWSGYAR